MSIFKILNLVKIGPITVGSKEPTTVRNSRKFV
jgi:hypothetical protein